MMKGLSVLWLFLAGGASAMTMSELQSAVDAAADGGTVYVTSDIEFAQPLTMNSAKAVTIRSDANGPWTLTRAASFNNGVLLLALNNGASVTFADLVVDGNKAAGKVSKRLVENTNGSLTLDAGAVLRDFWSSLDSSVSINPSSGATANLTMNDGAVVRGFENDSYGVFVTVGRGSEGQSIFTMNGGLITGCKGHYTKDSSVMDGVVYLYGKDWNSSDSYSLSTLENHARFYFRGGTITGNTSDRGTAGIMAYAGSVWLSGNAFCTNNVGKCGNNLFQRFKTVSEKPRVQCPMVLESRYTGRLTFQNDDPQVPGDEIEYKGLLTGATDATPGANNVVSEQYPELTLDTYGIQKGGWWAKWVTAQVKVLGRYSMPTTRLKYSAEWPLWAALKVAEDGDTVQVCSDIAVGEDSLVEGKDIVVESAPGRRCVVDRRMNDSEFVRVTKGGRLRLRNIIFTNTTTANAKLVLTVYSNSSLFLEDGAELRGDSRLERTGAVMLIGSGAYMKMSDGALITGFRDYYGSAVKIGENKDVSPLPRFEMTGGVISNNVILSSQLSYVNGAAVFLNRGLFDMSGGLITANAALGTGDKQCAAGVVAYKSVSVATFSGNARVFGNVGDRPDFYCYENGSALFSGDFRGRIGYSGKYMQSTVYVDERPPVKLAAGATGAWNLFGTGVSCEHPDLVGTADGTDIVLKRATGSVDGIAAAAQSDFTALLPTAIDISDGSADLQGLPHVLTGEARQAAGTITLSYDPATITNRFPVVLFQSGDDGILSRNMTFTYPAGSDLMRVRRRSSGHQLALDELTGARAIVR